MVLVVRIAPVEHDRLDTITRSADDADEVLPVYTGFDHIPIAVVRRARRVARNLAECHAATVHGSVACRKCSFGGLRAGSTPRKDHRRTYLCRPPTGLRAIAKGKGRRAPPDGPAVLMRLATALGEAGLPYVR